MSKVTLEANAKGSATGKRHCGSQCGSRWAFGAALYDPIFTSGITSSSDLAIVMVAFAMLIIWRLSPLFAVLWCVAVSVLPTLLV